MPEIKIKEQEIKSAFDTLKDKTNDFHPAASKPVFRHSSLQFLKFLQELEERYDKAVHDYKTRLLKAESDAWSNIESFVETEHRLADNFDRENKR